MDVLNILIAAGLIPAICYIIVVIAKVIVIFRITSNKSRKVSDSSIESMTKMMSRNIKPRFRK